MLCFSRQWLLFPAFPAASCLLILLTNSSSFPFFRVPLFNSCISNLSLFFFSPLEVFIFYFLNFSCHFLLTHLPPPFFPSWVSSHFLLLLYTCIIALILCFPPILISLLPAFFHHLLHLPRGLHSHPFPYIFCFFSQASSLSWSSPLLIFSFLSCLSSSPRPSLLSPWQAQYPAHFPSIWAAFNQSLTHGDHRHYLIISCRCVAWVCLVFLSLLFSFLPGWHFFSLLPSATLGLFSPGRGILLGLI